MKSCEKAVIGIDQSYNNTGISVAIDKSLCRVMSVELCKYANNSERRQRLSEALRKAIEKTIECYNPDELVIIIERIRLQSKGFLNIDYIKSIGALNAIIVDIAHEYPNIIVYSVDTRSWKSQVVGTSKPLENIYGIAAEKWPTIKYVRKLGFEDSILKPAGKKKKGIIKKNGIAYKVDDDAADSACIALYGFLPAKSQKLQEEH